MVRRQKTQPLSPPPHFFQGPPSVLCLWLYLLPPSSTGGWGLWSVHHSSCMLLLPPPLLHHGLCVGRRAISAAVPEAPLSIPSLTLVSTGLFLIPSLPFPQLLLKIKMHSDDQLKQLSITETLQQSSWKILLSFQKKANSH